MDLVSRYKNESDKYPKRHPNWGYDTYKSKKSLVTKSPDPPSTDRFSTLLAFVQKTDQLPTSRSEYNIPR